MRRLRVDSGPRAPRQGAILVYDDVTLPDGAGPADVFAHAGLSGGDYETALVSPDGSAATTSSGITLQAGRKPEDLKPVDIAIIPGAPAQAGALDGRRATTHWNRIEQFGRSYPSVRVKSDVLFVRDGSFLTPAGVSSGMFMQGPGGCSQFPRRSRSVPAASSPLRPLLDAISAEQLRIEVAKGLLVNGSSVTRTAQLSGSLPGHSQQRNDPVEERHARMGQAGPAEHLRLRGLPGPGRR